MSNILGNAFTNGPTGSVAYSDVGEVAPARQKTLLSALPGYPFFPCKICQRDGFNGQGSCDHAVFERARAMHPTLQPAPTNTTQARRDEL